jgi:hypothetical protein
MFYIALFGEIFYHFIGYSIAKKKKPDIHYNSHYLSVLLIAMTITALCYDTIFPGSSWYAALFFGLTANSWVNKVLKLAKMS